MGGSKQKVYVDSPRDVVHENPYGTLEHALTSFMASMSELRENSIIFVASEKESR